MLDELLKGDNVQMSFESLISIVTLAAGCLVWFVRVESKTSNNQDRIAENGKTIEKLESRVSQLQERHEQVQNEVRNMLFNIQKSISNIEGRLSLNSNSRGE